MKAKILLLFLFFLSTECIAQDREFKHTHHVATYKASWGKGDAKKQAKYYLLLTNSYSVFIPERSYYIDTLEAMGLLTSDNFNTYFKAAPKVSAGIQTDFLNTYKYVMNNHIKTFMMRGGKSFVYEERLDICKWKIHSETQQIAGYACQRATTSFSGRDYEAWFTTEVPHRDGPYKFNGLPGLIVKISDTEKHYMFTLMDFKEAKWPAFGVENKHVISITKRKFYEKESDFWENRIGNMQAAGVSLPNLSPEEIERRDKAARKRYNPIERIVE